MGVRDSFLIQVLDGPRRFVDREELVGNLIINGRLGCSDHGIVGCSILRGKVADRVQTIDFKRPDFELFRELVGGIIWEATLKGKGAEESLLPRCVGMMSGKPKFT